MKLFITIKILLRNKIRQYFDKPWLSNQPYVGLSLRHKAKVGKDFEGRYTPIVLCLIEKCWNLFELGGMVNVLEECSWILFSSLHELLLDVLPSYRLSELFSLLIHFYNINSLIIEIFIHDLKCSKSFIFSSNCCILF